MAIDKQTAKHFFAAGYYTNVGEQKLENPSKDEILEFVEEIQDDPVDEEFEKVWSIIVEGDTDARDKFKVD